MKRGAVSGIFRLWILCALGAASHAGAEIIYTGVNLPSGAASGGDLSKDVYPWSWYYPSMADVDYYVGKGLSTLRAGVLWERLQPTLNGDLSSLELSRLDAFVSAATARGAYVLLDPHNYARYNNQVIGSAAVPTTAFADFWGRMAAHYKDNNRVLFGLVNEPYNIDQATWVTAANQAIAAIRAAGATNHVLVPGTRWTGAWTWNNSDGWGPSNASTLTQIVDPGNNFAVEVHQYFDQWSAGQSEEIYGNDPNLGVARLTDFTNWLKANHLKGFLGEFAVANSKIGTGADQVGDELLKNMFAYMNANQDAWEGWTWWTANPTWSSTYMYTCEPIDLGLPTQADQPVMAYLQAAAAPEPASLAAGGLGCLLLLLRRRRAR